MYIPMRILPARYFQEGDLEPDSTLVILTPEILSAATGWFGNIQGILPEIVDILNELKISADDLVVTDEESLVAVENLVYKSYSPNEAVLRPGLLGFMVKKACVPLRVPTSLRDHFIESAPVELQFVRLNFDEHNRYLHMSCEPIVANTQRFFKNKKKTFSCFDRFTQMFWNWWSPEISNFCDGRCCYAEIIENPSSVFGPQEGTYTTYGHSNITVYPDIDDRITTTSVPEQTDKSVPFKNRKLRRRTRTFNQVADSKEWSKNSELRNAKDTGSLAGDVCEKSDEPKLEKPIDIHGESSSDEEIVHS